MVNDPSSVPHVEADGGKVLQSLRLSRMVLPILLGVAAVGFLFYYRFDAAAFRNINWTATTYAWIAIAALLMVLRHVFYAWRLRTITRGYLTWWKCMQLIVIWEFSAALTPTSKGGPIVMLFVLAQENLSPGRTAAAVFYTMVCDAGFFVLTLPIWLAIYGPPMLYPGMESFNDLRLASGNFFSTYLIILSYWLFLVFLLFVRPQYTRQIMHWLAQRKLLHRWADKLDRVGQEFELAANELKSQRPRYHFAVILATLGAWTSKFIMINCLIIAIVPSVPVDGQTQAFIYARLVAMFTMMNFSPTPGGAGIAELALSNFISDYVPKGIGMVVALLWRAMSYYFYLILGAFIVPAWIAARVASKPKAVE
jgi:uncharacterized protein (TIRG00374 family)